MRSIWSLWTKPLKVGRSNWSSELHHLLAWVLSVETARKHYPHTSLFTDDFGAEMLIEGVGLEFEHVSTALNALDRHDPSWWAIGKMYTYRSQSEPFVHIDSDVFLWNSLPVKLESADLLVQNPEYFTAENIYFRPEQFESPIHNINGWIPEEFDCYMPVGGIYKFVNCGILGGKRVDFISYYADLGITLMEHPRNQAAWSFLEDQAETNVIFEQYLLAACIEYHKNKQGSPYKGINCECLFESQMDAYNRATQVGYTHLLAGAKREPIILERLERRVKQDYPEYYERCLNYISNKKPA